MKAIDLEGLLTDATADELAGLPITHPLRTPACPPTPRFYKGVRDGWSIEERRHVNSCEFCQRATALEWRIECPGLWTVMRYAAEEGAFEDLQAMRRHLELDRCRRCTLILSSRFVKTLADMLRAGKGSVNKIRRLAEQAIVVYTRLPRLATDGVHFEPLERGERFGTSAESEKMNVALWERASGDLEISLDATDVTRAQVEVIGQSKTRLEIVELEKVGERRVQAIQLGSLREQVRELGEDCLVLAAPVAEDLET
jgi:hypothetical protein